LHQAKIAGNFAVFFVQVASPLGLLFYSYFLQILVHLRLRSDLAVRVCLCNTYSALIFTNPARFRGLYPPNTSHFMYSSSSFFSANTG
jgi:hypothetical protein